MILDTIDRAEAYVGLHPFFGQAFDYMARLDPGTVVPGTYELQGPLRVYVIISRTAGQVPATPRLEAHRRYIRLSQVTLSGSFSVGWRALEECALVHQPYDPDKDAVLYDDQPETTILLPAGSSRRLLPGGCHAPPHLGPGADGRPSSNRRLDAPVPPGFVFSPAFSYTQQQRRD